MLRGLKFRFGSGFHKIPGFGCGLIQDVKVWGRTQGFELFGGVS